MSLKYLMFPSRLDSEVPELFNLTTLFLPFGKFANRWVLGGWSSRGGLILSSLLFVRFLYTRTFSCPAEVPLSVALAEAQMSVGFSIAIRGLVACLRSALGFILDRSFVVPGSRELADEVIKCCCPIS